MRSPYLRHAAASLPSHGVIGNLARTHDDPARYPALLVAPMSALLLYHQHSSVHDPTTLPTLTLTGKKCTNKQIETTLPELWYPSLTVPDAAQPYPTTQPSVLRKPRDVPHLPPYPSRLSPGLTCRKVVRCVPQPYARHRPTSSNSRIRSSWFSIESMRTIHCILTVDKQSR